MPREEPENSALLRILVQGLVAVGIVATDVAAADVADPLGAALWAVPVSALGATWSWYRRRSRNIPVKFCIAIAMLIALAAFLVRLVGEPNDPRLGLAELLIQLQVFHSFDLPRRKDLGYSMVIGLILIGVAGTLSQTIVFGPLLVLFLAIALPVLVLDYRSRLKLTPHNWRQISINLAPRRLLLVLAMTLLLGGGIFVLLPRLPGYQLRTFPVSSPIDFDGQFDGQTIINPGYVREGRGGTGTGTGETGSGDGPGQLDDSFYYGFNSRINQNLRGEMRPQIVMRVRSQAPGFWRVLAFDHYTGQGWEISRNGDDQVATIDRPSWSYRFLIPWSAKLNRTREVIQSYTVVSDLPNLIPVMYQPKELYFPTRQVAIDPEGSLRSPVELSEGLTYTVLSEVPYRERSMLGRANQDYPAAVEDFYLAVPEAIAATVRQQTQTILDQAPNPLSNPYEQALYLAQYLKQNYDVQPDLPFLEEGEDLVEAFLLKLNGGYPDHFSTVLTVMLRSIGIPARLVVGFGPGQFNPLTGFYVVRNIDAYAMTEVYFPQHGWFAFDPIPGHELLPPSIEDVQTFSALEQFWKWVAGWLPSPVTGVISRLVELMTEGIGWTIAFLSALFTRGWLGLLLALGIVSGICGLGWLTWHGWQAWSYRLWLTSLPPMEALYQQMLGCLGVQGVPKSPSQTPLEYVQHCRQQRPAGQVEVIDDISQAYVSWRYGGQVPNLRHLRQRLQTLRQMSRRSQRP